MKTITIPVNNRPEYLSMVLDSIRAAEGFQDWTLLISAEPGCVPVLDLVSRIEWMPCKISVNRFKRGINMNTLLAADLAASVGSDFNLYLEDDILISQDALLLADWFRSTEESLKPSVLAFRRLKENKQRPHYVAHSHDGLYGDGFCYQMKWWEWGIRSFWLSHEDATPGFGWDWSVAYLLGDRGYKQYRPLVNRSENIGIVGTNANAGFVDPAHASPRYQGLERKFRFVEPSEQYG